MQLPPPLASDAATSDAAPAERGNVPLCASSVKRWCQLLHCPGSLLPCPCSSLQRRRHWPLAGHCSSHCRRGRCLLQPTRHCLRLHSGSLLRFLSSLIQRLSSLLQRLSGLPQRISSLLQRLSSLLQRFSSLLQHLRLSAASTRFAYLASLQWLACPATPLPPPLAAHETVRVHLLPPPRSVLLAVAEF